MHATRSTSFVIPDGIIIVIFGDGQKIMALLFLQLPLSCYRLDTFLISCIVSIIFILKAFNSYSVLKTRNQIIFATNPGIFVLHYGTNTVD